MVTSFRPQCLSLRACNTIHEDITTFGEAQEDKNYSCLLWEKDFFFDNKQDHHLHATTLENGFTLHGIVETL